MVSGGRNPVGRVDVQQMVDARLPGQGHARRDIVELVGAVGWPREQTAARAARCAVRPRIAVDHVVVVVVVSLIGTQRRGHGQILEDAIFERERCAQRPGIHRVVVVQAGGPNGICRRRAVDRRIGLIFGELGTCRFGVECDPRGEFAGGKRGDSTHHVAGLRVVLDRLADEEVLQEIHARASVDAGDVQRRVLAEDVARRILCRHARARCVAKAFRIRIGLALGSSSR